jgi:hypothetical protein
MKTMMYSIQRSLYSEVRVAHTRSPQIVFHSGDITHNRVNTTIVALTVNALTCNVREVDKLSRKFVCHSLILLQGEIQLSQWQSTSFVRVPPHVIYIYIYIYIYPSFFFSFY